MTLKKAVAVAILAAIPSVSFSFPASDGGKFMCLMTKLMKGNDDPNKQDEVIIDFLKTGDGVPFEAIISPHVAVLGEKTYLQASDRDGVTVYDDGKGHMIGVSNSPKIVSGTRMWLMVLSDEKDIGTTDVYYRAVCMKQ